MSSVYEGGDFQIIFWSFFCLFQPHTYIGAVIWRCFMKKVLLKILQNSEENHCAVVSASLLKKTPTQVLSCWFGEIFKNAF